MANARISPVKLLLIVSGLAAAGMMRIILVPHPSGSEKVAGLPEAGKVPGPPVRTAAVAWMPDNSSGRERIDLAPPGPGVATKVSNRSASLSSSASPVRLQESEQSVKTSLSPEVSVSPAPIHGNSASAGGGYFSPLTAGGRAARSSSSSPSARDSANAARIAQSAAAIPLAYSVTDDQVRQAAPHVPQDTLDQVRAQFDQSVGAGQLDPADPQYASDWDRASRAAADRLRALYGWGAYASMQRQAALAAASQTGK